MLPVLIVSNFLLWVVVLLQIVAIAALARRLRPSQAPQRGVGGLHLVHSAGQTPAPVRPVDLSWPDEGEGAQAVATMILHVSDACPVGQRLVADAGLMAHTADLRFLLARGPAHGGEDSPFAGPRGRGASRTGRSEKAPGQVPAPYLTIIDATGQIAAQGVVKSRPDLARLVARASTARSSAAGA